MTLGDAAEIETQRSVKTPPLVRQQLDIAPVAAVGGVGGELLRGKITPPRELRADAGIERAIAQSCDVQRPHEHRVGVRVDPLRRSGGTAVEAGGGAAPPPRPPP